MKDLIEEALQKGEVPMALPVSSRSKRLEQQPRKRKKAEVVPSIALTDQAPEAAAPAIPDPHQEVVTESSPAPAAPTVVSVASEPAKVVVSHPEPVVEVQVQTEVGEEAAGAKAMETAAEINNQGWEVAQAAPAIEEAVIGQTRVTDPALRQSLKAKLLQNAAQFKLPG